MFRSSIILMLALIVTGGCATSPFVKPVQPEEKLPSTNTPLTPWQDREQPGPTSGDYTTDMFHHPQFPWP